MIAKFALLAGAYERRGTNLAKPWLWLTDLELRSCCHLVLLLLEQRLSRGRESIIEDS